MELVFDPLEFLAEITRHIPAPGMQMVRIEKRNQTDVIERILKHCGLWHCPASRAPPQATGPSVQPVLDLAYVNDEDFLMAL